MRRSRWRALIIVFVFVLVAHGEVLAAKMPPTGRQTSRSSAKTGQRSRARRQATRKVRRRRRGRRYTSRYRRAARSQTSIVDTATPASPGIPTERVVEIQSALIKLGYLEGPASGQYDDSTTDAMKKFQADNGLPRSGLPSALTLKKLGVSKHSSDVYSVPVKSGAETDRKQPPQFL